MERILKRTLRCALADNTSDYGGLLLKSNTTNLELGRLRNIAVETNKIENNLNQIYLSGIVNRKNAGRMTRQTGNLDTPRVNAVKYGQHSLRFLAPKIWNALLKNIPLKTSLTQISNLVLYRGVV